MKSKPRQLKYFNQSYAPSPLRLVFSAAYVTAAGEVQMLASATQLQVKFKSSPLLARVTQEELALLAE